MYVLYAKMSAPRRSDSEILQMRARRRGGDGGDDADAWVDALYDHEEQLLRERKNRRRGYRDFAIAISVILVLTGVIILIAYFAGAFRNAGTVNGNANGRYVALLGERFSVGPANIYEAARLAGMDISFR